MPFVFALSLFPSFYLRLHFHLFLAVLEFEQKMHFKMADRKSSSQQLIYIFLFQFEIV